MQHFCWWMTPVKRQGIGDLFSHCLAKLTLSCRGSRLEHRLISFWICCAWESLFIIFTFKSRKRMSMFSLISLNMASFNCIMCTYYCTLHDTLRDFWPGTTHCWLLGNLKITLSNSFLWTRKYFCYSTFEQVAYTDEQTKLAIS